MIPSEPKTIAWCIAGELTADNLAAHISEAPELGEGIWAPLLSRWCGAYGHALAQGMVLDSALDRAGLAHLISYAVPAWPQGAAEEIVMAHARSPVGRFLSPLVKVPRAIFASQLYRHHPLGTEFVHSVARTRGRALSRLARGGQSNDKIYVSRLNIPWRRMVNEAELVECLLHRGFAVVAGEQLSFDEQVRKFAAARLIVGAYGSGLANAAFAAPNAALCELRALNSPDSAPNSDDFFLALAAATQLTYGVYVAENSPGADDWECDIPQVLELVDTAAAAIGRA